MPVIPQARELWYRKRGLSRGRPAPSWGHGASILGPLSPGPAPHAPGKMGAVQGWLVGGPGLLSPATPGRVRMRQRGQRL